MTVFPPAGGPVGLGEFGRIARFLAPLAETPGALGLVDDGALIALAPNQLLVVTVDAMVEGVHFLASDPPSLVARKLLRVNLSDLAAMAAAPDSYALTMALPARCDDVWVAAFAEGLAADQREFGISLLGGDSVSTPGPVTLTATLFGRVAVGAEVRRSGASPGDLVFVSGTIGDGALGLLAATGRLEGLEPAQHAYLVARYRTPDPRVGLGRALAGVASAMIDVSDGLVADLGHIAGTSGVTATVESARIPISDAVGAALALDPDLLPQVLTGGDDYELLFTAPPDRRDEVEAAARRAGVAVAEIGRVRARAAATPAVTVVDRTGVALSFVQAGWQHS